MPSRFFCLSIVAFWLATTGWWFYQEVGLPLWYDEPPPFTIDLADEVRAASGTITWQVLKDNQPVGSPLDQTEKAGTAFTEVRYLKQSDLFELIGKFDFKLPLTRLAR